MNSFPLGPAQLGIAAGVLFLAGVSLYIGFILPLTALRLLRELRAEAAEQSRLLRKLAGEETATGTSGERYRPDGL